MRKDTLLFAATTAFATVVAVFLWTELRESKKLIATLQQQVDMRLASPNANPVRPTASVAELQPSVASATTPPPVAQPVSDQASSPAGTNQYPGCDEATLTRTSKSAATTIARWAAELQLLPDEVQRLTEARQAEMMARLPCVSAGGSTADVNQLQEQFLAALGPARLEQLLELNADRETRNAVSTMSFLFKENDMPLRDEQTRQLTAVLLEENRRSQREALRKTWPSGPHPHLAYLERDLQLAEERAKRILTAAQHFLDPEQLADWRDTLRGQNDGRRSSLETFRKRTERGEEFGILLAPLYLAPSL
jgi:hypothetical protein